VISFVSMGSRHQTIVTVTECINCDGDAGRRRYLTARTDQGTFRYRVCARCMERLNTVLADPAAAEQLLGKLFVRILERTFGRRR
jgi:hypothetical protein